MLKVTLLGLSVLLFSGPAFPSECDNAQDQATMTKCAGEEIAEADKQLNANYKEIEKRLADDHDTKKLLITAQRAWMTFRNSECNFSSSASDGGSIHPMMIATCKAQLTTDRNKQLTDYLNCLEGDLTCPVPHSE